MPKIIFFHTPEFFPPMDFFYGLLNSDIWVVIDHVTFVARSRESRCRVRAADGGVQLLPVTVNRPCNKLVCNTIINNMEPWKPYFLKYLKFNYWTMPFFKQYFPEIQNLINSPHVLLETLTLETTLWTAEVLGKRIHHIRTCNQYSEEKVSDIIPIMLKELKGELFDKTFVHPTYPQRSDPFEKDLSIVDALFCIGADNTSYLLTEKSESNKLKSAPSKNIILENHYGATCLSS